MRDEQQRDVGGPDPGSIRSIAVTVDDVVAAIEATKRGQPRHVLRITPPFYGRMRARLHREGGEGSYDGDVEPIHLPPDRFLSDDAPSYPDVDELEDQLRETGEYDVETHRERYAEAVEAWRGAVRDHLVDTVTVEADAGAHEIQVKRLG